MSIKVMNWVWEHSTAKGSELLLLLAIADTADDRGRNAFPSISTLAGKTRMSRRTVQRLVVKLETDGHLVLRREGGRRSNSYEIVVENPSVAPNSPQPEPVDEPPEPSPAGDNLTPGQVVTGDNLTPRRGDNLTPQGCHSHVTPGVTQPCHPNHHVTVLDPPPPAPPPVEHGGGGSETSEPTNEANRVLAELGADWRIGERSAARLEPAIRSALANGWSAPQLTAELGKSPEGVRSPYAVLSSRLRDLPPAPFPAPQRPDWCGACHEATRMLESMDGLPYRCPICHPGHDAKHSGAIAAHHAQAVSCDT
jgi:hypothetical protein